MSLDQKRARANRILKEIGFSSITADNWEEHIVDFFLHYND